jgi:hypothetical protein
MKKFLRVRNRREESQSGEIWHCSHETLRPSVAVTAAKQILRLLAGQADTLDADFETATKSRLEDMKTVPKTLLDLMEVDREHQDLITAMLNAQDGKFDAALYHICSTQFDAQEKINGKASNKEGPESFLPKLHGTEQDKANSLPQSMGRPISRLQSLLQKRRQELIRYNVSQSFHLSSIVQKLMMSCNV